MKLRGLSKKVKYMPTALESELVDVVPEPAVKHLPTWYRKMPRYATKEQKQSGIGGYPNHTAKACMPFFDVVTAGYILTTQADIWVGRNDDGTPNFSWKCDREMMSSHSLEQVPGLTPPAGYEAGVHKFHNWFMMYVPKGYSILYVHPSNRYELPFHLISGLVDVDNYNIPVQFPFWLKEGFEGLIPKGTPIVQLIPIKRENWELERLPYNVQKEYIAKWNWWKNIFNSYKMNHWVKKQYK